MPAAVPWLVLPLAVALQLLELHGPDGQVAWVNSHEITALRAPTKTDMTRYFPRKSGCIITLTDGKFLAVIETCPSIRDRLRQQSPD